MKDLRALTRHAGLYPLLICLLLLSFSSATVQAGVMAQATLTTKWNDKDTESARHGGGVWALGVNIAAVDGAIDEDPPAGGSLTAAYREGDSEELLAIIDKNGFIAESFSSIDVKRQNDPGFFAYELKTAAGVTVPTPLPAGKGIPSMFALAIGGDPQSIVSPGIVAKELLLGAGTQAFSSGDATSSFQLEGDIFDIAGPLFSIGVTSSGGFFDVFVDLTVDPRLAFFDPLTDAPLTAADIESLLESQSELGTLAGLSSDLPLFAFSYDLTNTPISADAAFRTDQTARASVSVPEPATLVLFVIGLAAAGCSRGQKRSVTTA